MADLTARFKADFAPFSDAVEKASAELKGLESGAGAVETSLNRMVDRFSGRQLIQDANLMVKAIEELGGTSQLTETELARMGATAAEAIEKMNAVGLGGEVSQGMRDLATHTKEATKETSVLTSVLTTVSRYAAAAFSVDAVIGFAKGMMTAADSIQKAADQTGMLTDEVQELDYIASQTGTGFDSLIAASQNLSAALGRDDPNVIDGLEALKINMADFMQLRPQEQLIQAAEAIAKIGNDTDRAAAAQAIFGNRWRDLMAAIKGGMRDLADEAPKIPREAVAALDAWGDAWEKAYRGMQQAAGEIVLAYVKIRDAKRAWELDVQGSINALPDALLGQASFDIKAQADAFNAAVASIKPAAAAYDMALKPIGITAKEVRDATTELDASIKKQFEARDREAAEAYAKSVADAAKELKEWQDAYNEVEAAGTDWRETIKSLDAQLVEHIELKLRAGVAADKLAKAYSLSDEALKAMTLDIRAQDEAQKRANATESETVQLRAQLQALEEAHEGTATDAKIAEINRWATAKKQALIDEGAWTKENAELIEAIRKERTDAVMVDMQQMRSQSQQSLQEVANHAQATYDFMLEHSERYTTQQIINQQNVARESQMAADVWQESFTEAGEAVMAVSDRAAAHHAAAARNMAMTWSEAMDAVSKGQGTMTTGGWSLPKTVESANIIAGSAVQGRYYGPVDEFGNPDYAALGMPRPTSIDMTPYEWGHRATGGPVSAGSPYVVGERGPELFIPRRGGEILPNGAGTGSSVVANIYVNGTGADVARVISAELTRMMRVGRKWPSV